MGKGKFKTERANSKNAALWKSTIRLIKSNVKSPDDVECFLALLNYLEKEGIVIITEDNIDRIRRKICKFLSIHGHGRHLISGDVYDDHDEDVSPTPDQNQNLSDNLISESEPFHLEFPHASEEHMQGFNPALDNVEIDSKIDLLLNLNENNADLHGNYEPNMIIGSPAITMADPLDTTGSDQGKFLALSKPSSLREIVTIKVEPEFASNSDKSEHVRRPNSRKSPKSAKKVTHTETTQLCPVCGKSISSRGNLAKHTQRMHSDKPKPDFRPYLCDQCPKGYFTEGELNNHMKVHEGIKPHVCQICKKTFAHKTYLQSHFEIHSKEKTIKCTYCPRAFRTKRCLKQHLGIHTGVRKYKCEPCGLDFVQIGSLIYHNRKHHPKDK